MGRLQHRRGRPAVVGENIREIKDKAKKGIPDLKSKQTRSRGTRGVRKNKSVGVKTKEKKEGHRTELFVATHP